ncbi:MFS transporter [Sulfolobus tengchongensis]|uniref:MFS transporter n=1 Tax=Sulfolobus tengchongensis TaxID=207809 RepID=A0AAX4L1G1_9CREN
MKKALLIVVGSLLLTISQWYAFFLVSQLSFIILSELIGSIVFMTGFITRAMGSVFFGHIGDRINRKTALILTGIILIISSILLTFFPNTVSLLVSRLLQGFSLGGEWGGASTIIVEMYSSYKFRGFIASFIQLAVPIAVILSSSTIILIPIDKWNYSFIIIIILSMISLILVKDMDSELVVPSRSKLPLLEAIRDDWKNILKAIGIKVTESAIFYIFTSFIFAESSLTRSIASIVLLSISLQLFFLPFFGYLSDIIGRKMVVVVGLIIAVLGIFSFFFSVALGEILFSISDSALYAPQSSIFTEIFDKKYRVTASNLSYQIASVLGGALAPLLIRETNSQLVIIVYICITLICVLLIKETKGASV